MLLIYLFMYYLWIIIIIIGKMLTCVLKHVRALRGIFYSIEEEMPLKSSSPPLKIY